VIWLPLGALVLTQIGYPLAHPRAPLVVATVVLGFAASVGHAVATRGPRVGAALVAGTTVGGLLVETLGVHTGFPFGRYQYSGALGPRLFGVPLVVPPAWTWMAWPAWVAAGVLARRAAARIALAGLGLAGWDLFLDPQMVAEGYWHWSHPHPGLPGVPGVPLTNYLGWLVVAALMMIPLARFAPGRGADAPMLALYLWMYGSSVLAHAAFLHLPGSAAWGALGMGLVAIPLAVAWRSGW
jgi:putative membrane protein